MSSECCLPLDILCSVFRTTFHCAPSQTSSSSYSEPSVEKEHSTYSQFNMRKRALEAPQKHQTIITHVKAFRKRSTQAQRQISLYIQRIESRRGQRAVP